MIRVVQEYMHTEYEVDDFRWRFTDREIQAEMDRLVVDTSWDGYSAGS